VKRPQTKFDADTMSHSKVIRSTKIEKFSLDQNLSLGQNFLAAEFFSLSTFYWSYNSRFWYVFASL